MVTAAISERLESISDTPYLGVAFRRPVARETSEKCSRPATASSSRSTNDGSESGSIQFATSASKTRTSRSDRWPPSSKPFAWPCTTARTHLGVTDVFGEDVGPPLGGVFTATQGLKTAWNSPLDERGIVGTAMGIAYAGGRPVCEIQFCDYGFNTIDLLKVAGNQRWAGAGNFDMPIVLMTPTGSGIRGSLYHSHSFESWASRAGRAGRSSCRRNAARRLRADAVGHRRPEPGHGAAAQGAAARPRRAD